MKPPHPNFYDKSYTWGKRQVYYDLPLRRHNKFWHLVRKTLKTYPVPTSMTHAGTVLAISRLFWGSEATGDPLFAGKHALEVAAPLVHFLSSLQSWVRLSFADNETL